MSREFLRTKKCFSPNKSFKILFSEDRRNMMDFVEFQNLGKSGRRLRFFKLCQKANLATKGSSL